MSSLLSEKFHSFTQIYTDGSKDPIKQNVGIGVFIPKFKIRMSQKFIKGLSVNTAEIMWFYGLGRASLL